MLFSNLLTFVSFATAVWAARSRHIARQSQSSLSVQQPPCDYKFITQEVDHFGAHNGTFQQRYSIFTEFFKPGGPIMFFEGEETAFLDCANTTIMYEFAKELGGIAVSLEHRYFGESTPFGPERSYTNDGFRYLTLDNVMADAVNFINQVRDNVTGAADSKCIVASGSYGGFQASAFRLNHPETFYGAIASSGPAMGFGNSSNSESYYQADWLNSVYQDRSREASAKIQEAFAVLEERLLSGDTATLKSGLGLCTDVKANDTTGHAVLVDMLAEIFMFAAEFNYAVAKSGRGPVALPLDKTINFALTATDPIQIINQTNWMWYGNASNEYYKPCINNSDPTFGNKGVPLVQTEVFNYVTCTYFPLNAAGYSNHTIFPPSSADASAQSCEQQYGLTPLTKAEIEERYHFAPADIQNSTRIIWSKGQYDPTSGVEPLSLPLTADRNTSRVLYAADTAHREDLFAPDPTDREGVIQLRAMELEIIKEWLNPVTTF